MTLSDLSQLSAKELKRIQRINTFSFHSFMLASVVFLARAFSEINPVILLLSFGLALSARSFYTNIRAVRALRQAKQKV
jgi:CRISPR/Cas system endoribonuclease Cas6 (RAMP superfamily)